MVRFVLKPVGNGKRYLKSFVLDTNKNETFILGRNVETGLDKVCPNSHHVSRSHVALHVKNGGVFVDAVARQENVVALDGVPCARGEQRPLQLNSKLSLLGAIEWFNYQLVREDEDNVEDLTSDEAEPSHRKRPVVDLADDSVEIIDSTATPKKSRMEKDLSGNNNKKIEEVVSLVEPESVPVATMQAKETITTEKKPSVDMEGLLRQYECEICYDTLAAVCTLIPCGDCFCFPCIQGWAAKKDKCPHCQQPFDLRQTVPNKIMDNAIREILKSDKEILKAWEQRVEDGNEARRAFMTPSAPAAPIAVNRTAMPMVRQQPPPQPSVRRNGSGVIDLT